MEFVNEETLKMVSGYSDRRSIERWVNSLGLNLLKVGKSWCVIKEDFEKALADKYQSSNNATKSQHNYKPRGEHEKKFLKRLQKYTAEL